jgi:hypothetical protein
VDVLIVVALVAGAIIVTIRDPGQVIRDVAFPAVLCIAYGTWRWWRTRV